MRAAVSLVQILQLLNQDLLPLYLINFFLILKVKRRIEQAVLGIFTPEMKSPHIGEKNPGIRKKTLHWYKAMKDRYPWIDKSYLCIPSTSTPSEWLSFRATT